MNGVMKQAGQAANKAAARQTFARHIEGKAKNTEHRKRADLDLFEKFLQSVNIPARGMFDNPQAWITYLNRFHSFWERFCRDLLRVE
jgi:hypothetical protein